MTDRQELLLKMYDQMFNDINRHILVVWQSVGVLVGAFTILALVEKKVVSLDIAVSLIVLIAGWSIAHHIDAAYWYNRNLVIIANIERQFLVKDDLRNIHYYFGAHRPDNKMIQHLRIQRALAIGLIVLVLIYHLSTEIFPWYKNWSLNIYNLSLLIPYITVSVVIKYLFKLHEDCIKKYDEFMTNSPGSDIDTESIHFGLGHGHDE